jgi:hypothetical protein
VVLFFKLWWRGAPFWGALTRRGPRVQRTSPTSMRRQDDTMSSRPHHNRMGPSSRPSHMSTSTSNTNIGDHDRRVRDRNGEFPENRRIAEQHAWMRSLFLPSSAATEAVVPSSKQHHPPQPPKQQHSRRRMESPRMNAIRHNLLIVNKNSHKKINNNKKINLTLSRPFPTRHCRPSCWRE